MAETQPFSTMDHVTEWLMRPRIGDSKPPTLWPSSAAALDSDGNHWGACRRRTFLKYMTEVVKYRNRANQDLGPWLPIAEQVVSVQTSESKYMHWIWEQGELFEAHMLDLFKESGIFLATQVMVYIPEFNVSGKIDAIVINPDTGKKIICEAKSVYGINGDRVLGSNFDRKNGQAGEPRDYNLMQIAIYQYSFTDDSYEYGQLIYGDRGTGRYAVYQVDVNKSTGIIRHRTISPGLGPWVSVSYTIFDILNVYKGITESIEEGVLPDRDFSIKYSFEQLRKLTDQSYKIVETATGDDGVDVDVATYETTEEFLNASDGRKSRKFYLKARKETELSKTIAEQFVKYKDRKVNGGREVKPPEGGDYQCNYCNYTRFCYDNNNEPRDFSKFFQVEE